MRKSLKLIFIQLCILKLHSKARKLYLYTNAWIVLFIKGLSFTFTDHIFTRNLPRMTPMITHWKLKSCNTTNTLNNVVKFKKITFFYSWLAGARHNLKNIFTIKLKITVKRHIHLGFSAPVYLPLTDNKLFKFIPCSILKLLRSLINLRTRLSNISNLIRKFKFAIFKL